jgi:hypothetical protein
MQGLTFLLHQPSKLASKLELELCDNGMRKLHSQIHTCANYSLVGSQNMVIEKEPNNVMILTIRCINDHIRSLI